jgi:hypothetical protein
MSVPLIPFSELGDGVRGDAAVRAVAITNHLPLFIDVPLTVELIGIDEVLKRVEE